MPGRALLIGASKYGEGFANLPAAEHDVEVMERALKAQNFEDITLVSQEDAKNASVLFLAIKTFCQSVADGVGIVYFSGHGMSVGEEDWLLPAGVSRDDAWSPTMRVSTDFSPFVAEEQALIILIIDACRDVLDHSTAKGGRDWSQGKVKDIDKRFVRFFGCSAGEQCHVCIGGDDGKDISVFTAALAKALRPEEQTGTLQDLLEKTEQYCKELASSSNPKLPLQQPAISGFRDINAQTVKQLVQERVFPLPLATEDTKLLALTEAFHPEKLHCLVIDSEHATLKPDEPLLSARVEDALIACGAEIWEAFRSYWCGRRLVDGARRPLADAYNTDLSTITTFPVSKVFKSQSTLEQVIRRVVQADLVFFDLTRFEPGALFLLGLRAATRRGLTICSHGQGWREGQKLDMPFNLSDLQVFSHSDAGADTGEDPVVRRLVKAVEGGFRQMARQPRYQDLPAYDSLRELGPDLDSWQTIPCESLVLTLCSFRPENRERWKYLERRIKKALTTHGVLAPQVRRLIDLGSSQLVSQSLYEHIRRVAGCVMDWSLFSPSTFMELGVRLAVSPWGAVQVIEKSFLPAGPSAARVISHEDIAGPELQQVGFMQALLGPRPYSLADATDAFADVAENLVSRRPFDEQTPSYGWIHSVVQEAIAPVSLSIPPPYQTLYDRAQSLRSDANQRDRRELTQSLFYASTGLKKDREAAALETRIAAWLYLEHRVMSRDDVSDEVKALHLKIGEEVAAELYDGDAKDFAFAEAILQRIQSFQ